jgi:very-short-patch-repair endonuclease
MIKCEICNKEFNRITTLHLRKHSINSENEYKILYPNAELFSKETLMKISNGTKVGMNNVETKKKLKYKKSKEHKLKIQKSIESLWKNGVYENVFTEERNKKVAVGKKEWWKTQNKEILNKWLGEYRGSDKHIQMCKSNQIKATKAGIGNKKTKPEINFENELKLNNIEYIMQYYVGGFPFDFYLPNENLLIEIDGEFYHPLSEDDCKYPIQFHNYNRDIRKTKVAIDNGYTLKRIRF